MKCFTALLLLALAAGIRSAPADFETSPVPQAFTTQFAATQQPEHFTTLAANDEFDEGDRRLSFRDLWDQMDRMNKEFEERFRKHFEEARDRLRELRDRLDQDGEQFQDRFGSVKFEGDELKVALNLKNVHPEEVEVRIENGFLKVKAHREQKEENKTNFVFDMNRQFYLPNNVDLDAAKCQFHQDGKLEVLFPRNDNFTGDRNQLRELHCQLDAELLAQANIALFKMEVNEFKANMNLKNFKPEEVKVTLENGMLKIQGHHDEQKEEKGHKLSFSSSVNRQFLLPENVDFDAARCQFHQDGKLEILIPRKDDFSGDRNQLRQVKCQTDAELLSEANVALFKMEDNEFKVNMKLLMKLFKPEDLKVSVKNGMLLVEVHHEVKKEEKGKFHFSFDFRRSFELLENVDLDNGKCMVNKERELQVLFPRKDDFNGDRNTLRQLNCEVEQVEQVTETPKNEEVAKQLQQNNVVFKLCWPNMEHPLCPHNLAFFKVEDQEFKLSFGLQNFKPEELKVKIENGMVKVEGHHEEEKEVNGRKLKVSSSFHRQYSLPENVDFDAAGCKFTKEGKLDFFAPRQDDFAGERNKLRELTCQVEA